MRFQPRGTTAALLALIALTNSIEHVAATDKCEVNIVAGPRNKWGSASIETWIFNKKTCETRRIATPNFDCQIDQGFEHGATFLKCGNRLDGNWIKRETSNPESFFDTVGSGKMAKAPSFKALKRRYDHLNDDDVAKPIYDEDFPKSFSEISSKTSI